MKNEKLNKERQEFFTNLFNMIGEFLGFKSDDKLVGLTEEQFLKLQIVVEGLSTMLGSTSEIAIANGCSRAELERSLTSYFVKGGMSSQSAGINKNAITNLTQNLPDNDKKEILAKELPLINTKKPNSIN